MDTTDGDVTRPLDDDAVAPRAPAPEPELPRRYEPLEVVGRGAWGEIRLVHDLVMDRVVAMKILFAKHLTSPSVLGRFLNEATITASLEHPGIVPVHDRGRLADGRPWFTMKAVRGRTLKMLLEEGREGEPAAADPMRLRRLVEVFARVCEGVGYAHSRGVVHRDLKPSNLMVGDLGEVLVLDWGVARRRFSEDKLPSPLPPAPALSTGASASDTRPGDLLGTVGYMSPEQAASRHELVDTRSDVYSLGIVLYEVLVGRTARSRREMRAWVEAARAIVPSIDVTQRDALGISPELVEVYERAVQRDKAERFADAREMAEAVRAWLDGAARGDRAARATADSDALADRAERTRRKRDDLRTEVRRALAALPPHAPSDAKLATWRLEDDVGRLDQELALLDDERVELLRAALDHAQGYAPAHARLASIYRERLLAAERDGHRADAARLELLLRRHDRGEHARFLAGLGALELDSEPRGATVRVSRYELRDRRLVAVDAGITGTTPFARELPAGSWLVELSVPGRATTRLPVRIVRDGSWDALRPGGALPSPVRVLALADDETLVPAGWADLGGDEHAAEPVPRARVWVDDFVAKRFPVTCREYLAFLDALHAERGESEALRHAPRWAKGAAHDEPLAVERVDGAYRMRPRADGSLASLDSPITQIDWRSAGAYARWLAAATGGAWRLPNELEWEKAARGVDERPFPWGAQVEATWARVLGATNDVPTATVVDSYPADESPYGVRGVAGNVRVWCENVWTTDGPASDGGVLSVAPSDPADPSPRAVRGGAWHAVPALCRAAGRFAATPTERLAGVGLRLVRAPDQRDAQ